MLKEALTRMRREIISGRHSPEMVRRMRAIEEQHVPLERRIQGLERAAINLRRKAGFNLVPGKEWSISPYNRTVESAPIDPQDRALIEAYRQSGAPGAADIDIAQQIRLRQAISAFHEGVEAREAVRQAYRRLGRKGRAAYRQQVKDWIAGGRRGPHPVTKLRLEDTDLWVPTQVLPVPPQEVVQRSKKQMADLMKKLYVWEDAAAQPGALESIKREAARLREVLQTGSKAPFLYQYRSGGRHASPRVLLEEGFQTALLPETPVRGIRRWTRAYSGEAQTLYPQGSGFEYGVTSPLPREFPRLERRLLSQPTPHLQGFGEQGSIYPQVTSKTAPELMRRFSSTEIPAPVLPPGPSPSMTLEEAIGKYSSMKMGGSATRTRNMGRPTQDDVMRQLSPKQASDSDDVQLPESLQSGARAVARVTFMTQEGGMVQVLAERARTPDELRLGLMFRRNLAPGRGMIFEFPDIRPRSMWMKNTFIPLDMIFIGADDTVVGIVPEVPPLSEEPQGVSEPAKYVIEVPGGFCRQTGIRNGDIVSVKNLEA